MLKTTKRLLHGALLQINAYFAQTTKIFLDVQRDAEGEQEDLLAFVANESAVFTFGFMDMLIRFADEGRCITFDNLQEWGKHHRASSGTYWTKEQHNTLTNQLNRYRSLYEHCEGEQETNPFLHAEMPTFNDDDFRSLFGHGHSETGSPGSDGEDETGAGEADPGADGSGRPDLD